MQFSISFIYGALLLLLSCSSASALSMVPYTLSEMEQEADWILIATPTHQESQMFQNRVLTRFTLKPYAYLLESPQSHSSSQVASLTSLPSQPHFYLLGGHVGEISQKVPGISFPKLHHPLILFLKCKQNELCRPLGWTQGMWGTFSSSLSGKEHQDQRSISFMQESLNAFDSLFNSHSSVRFKPFAHHHSSQHDLHWISTPSSSSSPSHPNPSPTSSPLSHPSSSSHSHSSSSTSSTPSPSLLHTKLSHLSPLSLHKLASLLNRSWIYSTQVD